MRLIDADKLANKIAGHSNYHGDSILAAIYCMAEGKQVGDIKPIDTEPVRHGKWVVDNDCGSIVLSCSLCGEPYWIEREEDLEYCKPNYCPNCGARMDGE